MGAAYSREKRWKGLGDVEGGNVKPCHAHTQTHTHTHTHTHKQQTQKQKKTNTKQTKKTKKTKREFRTEGEEQEGLDTDPKGQQAPVYQQTHAQTLGPAPTQRP